MLFVRTKLLRLQPARSLISQSGSVCETEGHDICLWCCDEGICKGKANSFFYIFLQIQVVHLILCFSANCWDFSELWQFSRWSTCHQAAQAWNPVYTNWHEGKAVKHWWNQSQNIFYFLSKRTLFNEHPVLTNKYLSSLIGAWKCNFQPLRK